MSTYFVTQPAADDLEDLLRTVRADDPGAARRMGSRFVQTFELLAHSPKMGRVFRPRSGLRRLNEGVYAVLYREVEKGVEILRVVHGMQDLDAMFG